MPSKSKATDTGAIVSEDAIRDRAYFLWETDGRPEGRGEHYWNVAAHEATQALIKQSSDGAAKALKGKTTTGDMPAAVKASKATKAKVKAAEGKPAKPVKKVAAKAPKAKKAATKPRAAAVAAKKAK